MEREPHAEELRRRHVETGEWLEHDDFASGLGWYDDRLPEKKPDLKLVPPLPANVVYLEDYKNGTKPAA